MGKKPISGGISGYLLSKHKCFNPKHVKDGGTRIINLIKSKDGSETFNKLKDIFERYWVDTSIKGKDEAREVTKDVTDALEEEIGLLSSNAIGVEMILRPDKYKKKLKILFRSPEPCPKRLKDSVYRDFLSVAPFSYSLT